MKRSDCRRPHPLQYLGCVLQSTESLAARILRDELAPDVSALHIPILTKTAVHSETVKPTYPCGPYLVPDLSQSVKQPQL